MTEINQDKRYKYIFDEILTLTDDGFVVVDNHDVITDINEQYCQYLKTTREYAIGRSIAEIIPNTKMIDIVNYAYQEEGAILRLSERDWLCFRRKKEKRLVFGGRLRKKTNRFLENFHWKGK